MLRLLTLIKRIRLNLSEELIKKGAVKEQYPNGNFIILLDADAEGETIAYMHKSLPFVIMDEYGLSYYKRRK